MYIFRNAATRGLACLGIAWAALAPARAQVPKDLELDARPMFGNGIQQQHFLPLQVELRSSIQFQGFIVADARDAPTRLPISIGPGQFRFELPVHIRTNASNDEAVIRLVNRRGRTVAKKTLRFNAAANYGTGTTVGWVGRGPGPGNHMARLHFIGISKAELLPEDPAMYDALDMLALPSSECPNLNAAQVEAIHDWVLGGGRLVIDSSVPEQHQGHPLFKRFGITFSGTHQSKRFSYTAKIRNPDDYYGEAVSKNFKIATEIRAIHMAGMTSDGGESNASHTTRQGLGEVSTTAVDLNDLVRQNQAAGVTAFLEELFLGPGTQAAVGNPNFYNNYSYYGEWGWMSALRTFADLPDIPSGLVFVYLALFCIVVVPVERLVLGRMKKQRWTWLTTALIVAGFCIMASGISLAARGTQSRRTVLSVQDIAPEGGGRTTRLECFIPSRYRTFVLNGGEDEVLHGVSWQNHRNTGGSFSYDHGLNNIRFNTPVWSPFYFTSTARHNKAPVFSSALRFKDGKPAGRILLEGEDPGIKRLFLIWKGALYQTEKQENGWLISRLVPPQFLLNQEQENYYGYGEEGDPFQQSGKILHNLAALSTTGPTRALARAYFKPGIMPSAIDNGGKLGVVMAELEQGSIGNVEVRNPKIKGMYWLRQPLTIEGGSVAPKPEKPDQP